MRGDPPLTRWDEAGTPASAAGDAVAARRWAEAAVHDEHERSRLRALLHELSPGVALAQSSDHQLVDALVGALVSGRLLPQSAPSRPLYALAPPAASAAAPPPSSAPRAAPSSAAAAPAVESTFGLDLDVAAMVQALTDAARDGVPFCEECERERQRLAAEGA